MKAAKSGARHTVPLAALPRERRGKLYPRFGKRVFDIVTSLLALIFLSPLFLLVAILIKLDSHGPVFYRGPRVGRHGLDFCILKFRTMYERAESYDGPPITAKDDPRVSPIGRLLRDTKINELPQFWNVLKGEMSVVGPRPEDPEVVSKWPEEVRAELLSVRPGITSPASVIYRNEEALLRKVDVLDEYLRSILPTKLRLELLYVRNSTLLTDLDVLLWTMVVLWPRIETRDIPENLLFWGPLARFVNRHVIWFLVDVLVGIFTLGVAGVLWGTLDPLHIGPRAGLVVALGIALFFALSNAVFGLNRIVWARARPTDAFDLMFSIGVDALALLIVRWQWQPFSGAPVGLLVFAVLLSFLGFLTVRYRTRLLTGLAARWLRVRGTATPVGERIVIVGAGETSKFAIWLLRNARLARAFTILGLVDDDPRKQGLRIDGFDVLGSTALLPDLVSTQDVGLILFAIAKVDPPRRAELLGLCRSTGAQVVVIPDLLNVLEEYFPKKSVKAPPPKGKLPADQVSAWLDELGNLAQQEDNGRLLARLDEMRASLLEGLPPEGQS